MRENIHKWENIYPCKNKKQKNNIRKTKKLYNFCTIDNAPQIRPCRREWYVKTDAYFFSNILIYLFLILILLTKYS